MIPINKTWKDKSAFKVWPGQQWLLKPAWLWLPCGQVHTSRRARAVEQGKVQKEQRQGTKRAKPKWSLT